MNETRHAPARDVAVSDDRYSTATLQPVAIKSCVAQPGCPPGGTLCDSLISRFRFNTGTRRVRRRALSVRDFSASPISRKAKWIGIQSRRATDRSRRFRIYRLADGDIVFARTGATTGKSFLISNCPEAVFASYLIRLRIAPGISPRYVHAFFQGEEFWRQIEASKRGIGQPNVNGQVLSRLTLPLPPLDEQQRIVATKMEKQFQRSNSGACC